jgi:hypothetical protein
MIENIPHDDLFVRILIAFLYYIAGILFPIAIFLMYSGIQIVDQQQVVCWFILQKYRLYIYAFDLADDHPIAHYVRRAIISGREAAEEEDILGIEGIIFRISLKISCPSLHDALKSLHL